MSRDGASVADKDDPFAPVAVTPSLLSYLEESDLSIGIVAGFG